MTAHGTRSCRKRGCDRPECIDACSRAEKEYRLRALTAPATTGVPAAPAAAHVTALHEQGMSYEAIAAAAGVSASVVKRLPRQRKTSHTTARAILTVTATADVGTHWIPALGTARRIQALHTLGYSCMHLAPHTGVTFQALRGIAAGEWHRVTSTTATRVAALYDELCMTPRAGTTRGERGAIARARGIAARNGWAPPLAWDNIDTDPGPDTVPVDEEGADEPDRVVIDRLLAGTRVDVPTPDRPPIVRVLAAHGRSDGDIARLLGVWPETVLRIRQRTGIPAGLPIGSDTTNRQRVAA